MIDLLAALLMLLGLLVSAAGVLGVIRLPDYLNRMHAATVISTLGTMFTMAGVALYGFLPLESGGLGGANSIDWNYPKSALIIVACAMLGGAIASHAIARACFKRGIVPKNLVVNEFAEERKP